MKKPNNIDIDADDDASKDIEYHPNNHKLFIKKDEKQSFLKLSLPLIITFWFPYMISFSSFGPNYGNQGNVGVSNKFTNMSSYPYLEDQGRNHTDTVVVMFNISTVYNDSTFQEEDSVEEEADDNLLQETSPGEDLFWKILGSSTLFCERQIHDMCLENKQELQSGQTQLSYLDLDEVRSIAKQDNGLSGAPSRLVNITHRLEPDGTKYNYAAASKGAKVVAHDKEAKGASNILGGDHDMYLRNPCSVPDKFVVIELAEETLVDTIMIANFEHHSSNFKGFELLGSLIFPTESWYELGTFVAENVKHRQYFKLPEPKWTRYVMLRLITHYGSEFYCTLSVFEAYGIDAIEKMLEDLIVASNPNRTAAPALYSLKKPDGKKIEQIEDDDDVLKKPLIDINVPATVTKNNGRIHSDAVLKILMQKIRSLENNLLLLEDDINGLNKLQGDALSHLDEEIMKYLGLVEQTKSEIKEFWPWKKIMEKEIADLESWKDSISFLLESIVKENAMLRQDIEKIARDEESIDKTERTLVCTSLSFAIVIAFNILSARFSNLSIDLPHKKVRRTDRSWKPLVFTCIVTTLVTLTFC